MPDPAIRDFFQKRKEDFLKKKVKSSMQEHEISDLKVEADQKFSKECWLPDAARRASQMSIASHPCTLSHPSARKNKNGYVTPVIARASRLPDGYLRTGNVAVDDDALGNAAVLDVYKFLTLVLEDGHTLLSHIQNDSEQAKALLTNPSASYQNLKSGLLSMVNQQEADTITSSKIKQVFFPIEVGKYHLLSVLCNSGLIYELRGRVDKMRFGEKLKQLRELKRNSQFIEEGFLEIYDIATIGYGGTKPQNISVLNNQFGGKARLLLSVPPTLVKRDIHFPAKDFFKSSIRFYDIRESLEKLHGIFKTGVDSVIPRRNLESGRDHRVEEILDQIIEKMAALREVSAEQYREESNNLPQYQKIWLSDFYYAERQVQEDWLNELCETISKWIEAAYKRIIKKPVSLGPAEHRYIRKMIEAHREVLR